MNLFATQYAFKSIIRRKRKNFITSLAIALGVALFIGAQSAGDGVVHTFVKADLNSIGETDITISNPASIDGFFHQNITNRISGSFDPRIQDNILSMAPVIQFTTSVYSDGLIEADIVMNGIRPVDTNFGNFIDNETGEIIDLTTKLRGLGTSDVLVSKTLAEDLDLNVDETITFSFTQGNGSFASLNLVVSAIYDDCKGRGQVGTGLGEFPGQLYVNLEIIQNELASKFHSSINQLNIIIKEVDRDVDAFDTEGKTFPGKSKIEDTMEALDGLFLAGGIDSDGNAPLIFSSRVNLVNTVLFNETIFLLKSILPVFAFMLNATALLLIVNIQIMAVEDRKNQTAVLRALGSNVMTIFTIFLIEATIIGVVGAFVGLGLGYLVSIWMITLVSDVFGVASSSMAIESSLVIISLVIGVLLSVLTAVFPALNAARSSVSTALRGIDEEKPPKRKGYLTIIIGIGLTAIGLAFASNIGEFWKKEAWNTFEKQAVSSIRVRFNSCRISCTINHISSSKTRSFHQWNRFLGIGYVYNGSV
ncbi:MAG: ABC transporter permease [Candidatus Heimdallarchaeota archaeon]|nr:ABC transporter permease [Candidatus Heimdallarchaeota archaeon]MCK5048896.1 ABC transporter permease [Candidatus Heimdallarchaeota archaeon]